MPWVTKRLYNLSFKVAEESVYSQKSFEKETIHERKKEARKESREKKRLLEIKKVLNSRYSPKTKAKRLLMLGCSARESERLLKGKKYTISYGEIQKINTELRLKNMENLK